MQSKWYGEQRKQEIHDDMRKKLLAIGREVEKEAKEIITEKVYDQPESPSGYRRTGLARSSIQTIERSDGVYVGSDIDKFKAGASETGGVTFYLPYIEFGHVLRNGNYYPARPFLRPALDKVRHKVGKL